MEQVRELLGLIKGVKTNGGLVAVSFIVRRVQPCKERAHAAFDFKGGDRRYPGEDGDVVEGRSARVGCRAIRSICLVQLARTDETLSLQKSTSSGKYLNCVFMMLFIFCRCQTMD